MGSEKALPLLRGETRAERSRKLGETQGRATPEVFSPSLGGVGLMVKGSGNDQMLPEGTGPLGWRHCPLLSQPHPFASTTLQPVGEEHRGQGSRETD